MCKLNDSFVENLRRMPGKEVTIAIGSRLPFRESHRCRYICRPVAVAIDSSWTRQGSALGLVPRFGAR